MDEVLGRNRRSDIERLVSEGRSYSSLVAITDRRRCYLAWLERNGYCLQQTDAFYCHSSTAVHVQPMRPTYTTSSVLNSVLTCDGILQLCFGRRGRSNQSLDLVKRGTQDLVS